MVGCEKHAGLVEYLYIVHLAVLKRFHADQVYYHQEAVGYHDRDLTHGALSEENCYCYQQESSQHVQDIIKECSFGASVYLFIGSAKFSLNCFR